MKRMLVCLLCLSLLLPACALAEKIDLSAYTIPELYGLRTRITTEIQARTAEGRSDSGITQFVDLGSVSVALNGFEVYKRDGKNYLIVNVNWINNDSEPAVFYTEATVEAYQDGVELDDGYLSGVDTNVGKKVLPGFSGTQKEIFQLTSARGEVVLIVSPLFVYTNDKPRIQITINLP